MHRMKDRPGSWKCQGRASPLAAFIRLWMGRIAAEFSKPAAFLQMLQVGLLRPLDKAGAGYIQVWMAMAAGKPEYQAAAGGLK
jgi:hypothetical protein